MTKIIAFAGKKQSGKTTCAEYMVGQLNQNFSRNAKIYNFADPLKWICMDILGLNYNQCYGTNEQKNELVDCHWQNKQLTAREVLQIVGTEMFRELQHNVWANATIRQIHKESPLVPIAFIADCRFPNEVEAIKNSGGMVIKLTRNVYNSDHASEIALDPDLYDQSNFDLIVDNQNLSIEDQQSLIYTFLQDHGVVSL